MLAYFLKIILKKSCTPSSVLNSYCWQRPSQVRRSAWVEALLKYPCFSYLILALFILLTAPPHLLGRRETSDKKRFLVVSLLPSPLPHTSLCRCTEPELSMLLEASKPWWVFPPGAAAASTAVSITGRVCSRETAWSEIWPKLVTGTWVANFFFEH